MDGQRSEFFEQSAPTRAALLWIDAMRVLGGLPPLSAPDAEGMAWKDFAKPDAGGGFGADSPQRSMLQTWIDLAWEDPEAFALVKARCGWCYGNDADHMDELGYYDPLDGCLVAVFPLDCPRVLEALPGPMALMEFDICMDGAWFAGGGPGSGAQGMRRAWDEMSSHGFAFDAERQKIWEREPDFDESRPMSEKAWELIPQLRSSREAEALELAATPVPDRPARRRGI